jgi:hypothetical protein
MKNDRNHDLPPGIEDQWREWATIDPAFDEIQLKRALREKIPERRPRPGTRLVLVAAAASLLAMIIGIESIRRPPGIEVMNEAVVHDTGANVILVLREGNEPIYIATERSNAGMEE